MDSERPQPDAGAGAPSRAGPGGEARSARSPATDDELRLALRGAAALRGLFEILEDAARIVGFGVWEWNQSAERLVLSERAAELFGLEAPGEVALTALLDRAAAVDRRRVREAFERARRDDVRLEVEYCVEVPGGGERMVRCLGERIGENRQAGLVTDAPPPAAGADDTRLRSAFASAPIGFALVTFDERGDARLDEVNRALCEIAERTEEELIGASMSSLCHPEDADSDLSLRERLLAGEITSYTTEKRCPRKGGGVGWVEISVSLAESAPGAPPAGVLQAQDVTERKRSEDQLRYIADHDSLTGLLSRRRFREELDGQLALKRRYGGEGALLLLDVDKLKTINDTHGHAVGDSVLRRVAEVLSGRVRSTDSVGRLAGDEFAVLMPSASPAEAHALAKSLEERLGDQEVAGWRVSVSIGVAPFGEGHGQLDADAVLAAADAAMYRAKHLPGGSPQPRPPASRGRFPASRTYASAGLPAAPDAVERALESGELLVYGQPAIDLRSGAVAHRELLVRMRGQNGSVLPAAEFLGSAAREPGLCQRVDRWVVQRAIALLGDGARGERLHVNLSGETVTDPDAVSELAAEVVEARIEPGALAFEVPDEALRRDTQLVEAALERLASTGAPVVLDGFGAAFGAAERLEHLPLEQIKIDGSIVRRLLADEPDHATVRAIVQLAAGTGRATVAKLVDSEELLPLLRMHGVDMAQGYELAAPAPLPA